MKISQVSLNPYSTAQYKSEGNSRSTSPTMFQQNADSVTFGTKMPSSNVLKEFCSISGVPYDEFVRVARGDMDRALRHYNISQATCRTNISIAEENLSYTDGIPSSTRETGLAGWIADHDTPINSPVDRPVSDY